jgi:uncharacterized OsmC-like protein
LKKASLVLLTVFLLALVSCAKAPVDSTTADKESDFNTTQTNAEEKTSDTEPTVEVKPVDFSVFKLIDPSNVHDDFPLPAKRVIYYQASVHFTQFISDEEYQNWINSIIKQEEKSDLSYPDLTQEMFIVTFIKD